MEQSTQPDATNTKVSLEQKIQDLNIEQQNTKEEEVKLAADYTSGSEDEGEDNKRYIEISVPKSEIIYKLKPQVIGDSGIKFYNAQDLAYYDRLLKEPLFTLWVLTANVKKLNYVNKRIWEAGWRNNIQVRLLETAKFDLIVSQEGVADLLYDGKPIKAPDAVLPRLGANIDYFGMAVVRQLEKLNILVLNSIESIDISKDKLYTLQELGAHSLPFPKTMIARFPIDLDSIEREFSYPIILKKSSGSQGKGVMLVQNRESLNDISEMIDTTKPLIFQEYISVSRGRDLRVFVIGGKVIGGMMRVAKKGFKANFSQGGYVKPVKLSAAVEWLAIESSKLCKLDIAGVDILIDQDTYKICEINSSPGFQGFELATSIDVPEKMFDFIKLRLGLWRKTQQPSTPRHMVTIPIQAEHLLVNIPKGSNDVEQSPRTPNEHVEKK
ncbi:hypothetical protein AKO1_012284 [Acrasis kona]|uniref:N-acetylaspartylglutamate synthase n=1 Tax=Acrasis kona TaxID=1008807 RepID=A0AAW2Z858_9EUKA